jgi:hypothetical protein
MNEQELRDFLTHQADIFATEQQDTDLDGDGLDYSYAKGAEEAYLFVLRFLDEYKAEEK